MCLYFKNVVNLKFLDYEQSLIFVRVRRVGEHASARGNPLPRAGGDTARRVGTEKNRLILRKMRDYS